MLRGTVHLVSVFLCFVGLLALTPQPTRKGCTLDSVKRVKTLMEKAPNLMWLDSRLYTPSCEDHERCPRSALECFATEVKVLTKEWNDVGGNVPSGLDKLLRNLAKTFPQEVKSNCRQCELLQEENAATFLNRLLTTLQKINSQNCKSKRSL